jgi:ketosteroid isomerase-like protein
VLKVMLMMKRKPGLSLEEFIDHYERVHVPLALTNARNLVHYERHYLRPGRFVPFGAEVIEPEYDVITELWYDSKDVFEHQQDLLERHPEVLADIVADEETLFDRSKSRFAYVEDHVSDIPTRSSTRQRDPAVQRLLDKDEIVDLVHRYSYLVDHKVHDEIAELFTEDCVVDYGIAPPLHGRDAVQAMFGSGAGFVATSHHNANVLVTFEDDDRAVVLTSLYAWHLTSSDSTPRVWGYYHDVAVRTGDGWRLAERVLRVAGNQDWNVQWHPLI